MVGQLQNCFLVSDILFLRAESYSQTNQPLLSCHVFLYCSSILWDNVTNVTHEDWQFVRALTFPAHETTRHSFFPSSSATYFQREQNNCFVSGRVFGRRRREISNRSRSRVGDRTSTSEEM